MVSGGRITAYSREPRQRLTIAASFPESTFRGRMAEMRGAAKPSASGDGCLKVPSELARSSTERGQPRRGRASAT